MLEKIMDRIPCAVPYASKSPRELISSRGPIRIIQAGYIRQPQTILTSQGLNLLVGRMWAALRHELDDNQSLRSFEGFTPPMM